MLIPDPAVSVDNANPAPLPMRIVPLGAVDASMPVPPNPVLSIPPKEIGPAVGTFGVKPVNPPLNDETPPPPVASIVIVPAPFVMLIPDPAVSVDRDRPEPLPMRILPFVAEEVFTPVPPLEAFNIPPNTTFPMEAIFGVKPVVPADQDDTPPPPPPKGSHWSPSA
jgi:hypothetical protein